VLERLQRSRAAMQHIEVFDSGFEFRDRPLRVLRPGRREQFQIDAETALECFLELLAQNGGWRSAGDDLAFLLRRLDDFFPFIGRIRRMGCSDEDKWSEKERAKDVEVNSSTHKNSPCCRRPEA